MTKGWTRVLPVPVVLATNFLAMGPSTAKADYPLFKAFPELEKRIPRVELVQGATPLEDLSGLESHLLASQPQLPLRGRLWVKRDDRSWEPLGGNKARKLEFLLADARLSGAETLVTSGMYGSNHAYTTALAARELGLKSRLILGPQPVTESVRKKLLAMHALGAEMHYHGGKIGMGLEMLRYMVGQALGFSKKHYYIPPGGSSELGSVGYVNAFFELLEQTGPDGLPDDIIAPVGTGGTLAGLMVGACLSGHAGRVRFHGVTTVLDWLYNERKLRKDARKLHEAIVSKLDPETQKKIPSCDYRRTKNLRFVRDYFPPEYGAALPDVHETIALLKSTDSLVLEATYTGKAMRHYLELARGMDPARPRKLLFWQTYNSHSLDQVIETHPWSDPTNPWKDLPKRFHKLFR